MWGLLSWFLLLQLLQLPLHPQPQPLFPSLWSFIFFQITAAMAVAINAAIIRSAIGYSFLMLPTVVYAPLNWAYLP